MSSKPESANFAPVSLGETFADVLSLAGLGQLECGYGERSLLFFRQALNDSKN